MSLHASLGAPPRGRMGPWLPGITTVFAHGALGALGLLAAASTASGCINVKQDYDDWYDRTGDARAAQPVVDSGTFEASLPEGGFDDTYFMACVSQIASSDITKATLFAAHVVYTPNGDGTGGQLTFSNQPLNSYQHTPTSLSDIAGPAATPVTTPVDADGKAAIVFGPSTVPGADNAVTGQDVLFAADATLHFIIGPGTAVCSTLTGDITQPFKITLDPSRDLCVFRQSTGDIPTLTQADVHCP
jgi:hypothetical protein